MRIRFSQLATTSLVAVFLIYPYAAHAMVYGIGSFLSTRMSDSEGTTTAGLLGELGVGWTRQEFLYEDIGGPSGTNYSPNDDALNKLAAQGIKVLGLLNYSGTPPSGTDWEAYVANVVSHYSAKVDAWEVMNEPNDVARPERYMSGATYNDYLARSSNMIRVHDSSATILGGAVAMVDTSWLGELVSAGGCSYLDAFSIHPYRTVEPETVKYGEGDLANYIGTAVQLIRRNCPSKKLWLSETGYRASQVGADNQANWLARSYMLARIYPEVDQVFSYLFRDDGSGDWGVVDSGFSKRSAFARVQQAFAATGNQEFDDEIVVVDRTLVDGLDSTTDWGQQFSINATANLTTTTGVHGGGLQIGYSFSASSAAAIVTKEIPISGQPTALGLYIYGDNSRAIWRLRLTDAQGETFQTLLGQGLSGWAYRQVDLSNTSVMNSWGGDGAIQYPIKFNSIVLDRDGGASSGTVKVDSLVAVSGAADFKALKFGTTVAAWKADGSGSASVCGQTMTLTEAPVYLSGMSGCSSNGITGISSSTTSTSSGTTSSTSSTKKTTTTSSVTRTVDLTKTFGTADRWFAYANGAEAISIIVAPRDSADTDMTLGAWALTGYRGSTSYSPPNDTTTPIVLKGTEPGLEELEILLEGGLTVPQKLRIIWLDPAWQSLPVFADIPDEWVASYDGATVDPLSRPGFEAQAGQPFGLHVNLPGLDAALVYVTFREFDLIIPLVKQADGTYQAVLPIPDYVGTSDFQIVALDSRGVVLTERTAGMLIQAASEPTGIEVVTSTVKEFPWVIVASSSLLVVLMAFMTRRRWWPGLSRLLRRPVIH